MIHPVLLAAALLMVLLALLARSPPAGAVGASGGWLRPVPGEVVRPFDYRAGHAFAPGAHRGADLAARPGAPVRAACNGRVVHAGVVARLGNVVTVRCGPHRVTYLPLGTLRVRSGAIAIRGAPLGTVASGHGGLHLGARRAGDRFAYEDPMARIGGELPPALVAARRPRPIAAPVLRPRAVPVSPRPAVPVLGPRAVPARPRAGARPALAPWPVWIGTALVLAGSAGSCTVAILRRRRRSAHMPTVSPAIS